MFSSLSQAVGAEGQSVNFKALPPLSLYIHIPWCARKCPYCDFNSHEAKGLLPEKQYVAALTRDLELALPQIWGRKVYSVFFGGGTPSILSAESIAEIMRQVRQLLPLDIHAEITMEANPGTVETGKLGQFRGAGINRLSLGIQSFSDEHLRALGRIHTAAEARHAIEIAQHWFDNINLDMMYALPGQALAEAVRDIEAAVQFAPQHLSCYHLTLEPNTLFHHQPPSLPDEDAASDMQLRIEELLTHHGYEHYETSAFARPGKRCRHNLNYWQFGDYLGIGAGAHSKLTFCDRVVRQMRYKQPQAYLQAVARGEPLQETHEVLPSDLPFEFMMNALRLNEGVDARLFMERTSLPLSQISRELEDAKTRGLLVRDEKKIAPTEAGRRFLNDLLQLFLH